MVIPMGAGAHPGGGRAVVGWRGTVPKWSASGCSRASTSSTWAVGLLVLVAMVEAAGSARLADPAAGAAPVRAFLRSSLLVGGDLRPPPIPFRWHCRLLEAAAAPISAYGLRRPSSRRPAARRMLSPTWTGRPAATGSILLLDRRVEGVDVLRARTRVCSGRVRNVCSLPGEVRVRRLGRHHRDRRDPRRPGVARRREAPRPR